MTVSPPPPSPMDQKKGLGRRALLAIVLTLSVGIGSVYLYGPREPDVRIDYDVFRSEVQKGGVASVSVQGERIDGVFAKKHAKGEGKDKVEYTKFYTFLPSFGDPQLLGLLVANDVSLATRPRERSGWISTLLITLLPMLFIGGLFYMQYKRLRGQGGAGGLFGIGKSKASLYDKSRGGKTFEDVGGASGAKDELREIITFLKDPGRLSKLGGKPPKGVLLVGPPGTGKTLLARAVAGEADVPFYSTSGSAFMEMFVGVGASRVRSMFEDAKKNAPAMIFIDELDSIGRKRGAGLGGGHDEREQTLNQLLNEMDGFEPNEKVVVMSATNRPDVLDPALLRPGRFDRRITVELPSRADRTEILTLYAANKPMAEDVDLDELSRATAGFSGADLENLLNEATLYAMREERDAVAASDIERARDKVTLGLERKGMSMTEEEKRLIACHEGGHALAAARLAHADPLHKVSIIPHSRSLGATLQLPEDERHVFRKNYLKDRLAVMMGGRAAEVMLHGTFTSGAASDLHEATVLARRMVLEWGMGEAFSHVALGGERRNVFLGGEIASRREYSEETAHLVDNEVKRLLDEAFERASRILKDNRPVLERLIDALLEHEEISGPALAEIVGPADPQ
ncbi:peptidase M41 FtsH domain protein [Desulfovibrio sp. X2]|uniref:ATP-dependent zinc metalloprotease FtsH n=1 Tax=Desulfovibrio sp. X2 TaxID=941449 RepID=UPI000358CEB0|nr:ATP-dependent zinc metalloprotease FtsH [Desulfovibrio sp. X2]EPR43365.1 peptidase M41 FtsH domain protein [Desulfovibrio sp. X2]